jgi:hypothetical protein
MIQKSKRKTLLPSKIEGRYSHYASTLTSVSKFDTTIMIENQETNKCERQFGDFVSLLHIRPWWDYNYCSEHQLENYICLLLRLNSKGDIFT